MTQTHVASKVKAISYYAPARAVLLAAACEATAAGLVLAELLKAYISLHPPSVQLGFRV